MRFVPSPTGKKFIRSRSFVKGIMGPVGGGKSTVCLMDLLARAFAQEPHEGVRRTKFAIVRNTAAQLQQTVKPLIDEWLVSMQLQTNGAALGQWRLTEKVFEVHARAPDDTKIHTELLLMHADTPDDVRRLLSLQLSAAWVEEAREIDAEVFKGLLGRVDRFPSVVAGGVTYPGVIFSTNAPVVDSYWHKLISDPPANVEVFMQPPAILDDGRVNEAAENLAYLSDDYYPNLMAANTPEWIDVYLKNQFGPGNAGTPVFKASFRRAFHVSPEPLLAIPHQAGPLVVGCDNGLQAAAVVMQQDARGRVNVLTECYVPADDTMGFERFLDVMLIPHLTAKFPTVPRSGFIFVLDPACFQRSQLNEATLAQAAQARKFQVLRASTNDPHKRISAVEGLLVRAIDGKAGLLIDPSCTHLIKALEWGFRHKKSADGAATTTFEKNHFSHCFPADVTVALDRGPTPISCVRVGDRVVTPAGLHLVTATMSRPDAQLVELEFDTGHTVQCTPDHPFVTSRGVVRADALEYADVVPTLGRLPCHEVDRPSASSENISGAGTTSPTMGTTTPARPSAPGARAGCTGRCGSPTTAPYPPGSTCRSLTGIGVISTWLTCRLFPAANIAVSGLWSSFRGSGITASLRATTKPLVRPRTGTCTGMSGKLHTGPYRQAVMSTTSTGIGVTTPSETLSCCELQTTCDTTSRSGIPGGGKTASLRPASLLRSGIATLRTTLCTLLPASNRGWAGSGAPSPVLTAGAAILGTWSVTGPGTAQPTAGQKRVALGEMTTSSESAHAGRASAATGTAAPGGARLVARRPVAQRQTVYDLTVADAHVFYANGLLVHNCADAMQYAALHYNAQISQTMTAFMSRAREVKPRAFLYA